MGILVLNKNNTTSIIRVLDHLVQNIYTWYTFHMYHSEYMHDMEYSLTGVILKGVT